MAKKTEDMAEKEVVESVVEPIVEAPAESPHARRDANGALIIN